MNDRPLEEYSLPYLWQRIVELETQLDAANVESTEGTEIVGELRQCITELKERLEWREDGHDGIYCRDETIKLLEDRITELKSRA
jgi:molybdopterin converting factor small subunit